MRERALDMFESNTATPLVGSEVEHIKEVIKSLEPMYREAVYLRYVEELTPKEIALVLGETTNVVSVRINRGVKMLREKLHIL